MQAPAEPPGPSESRPDLVASQIVESVSHQPRKGLLVVRFTAT